MRSWRPNELSHHGWILPSCFLYFFSCLYIYFSFIFLFLNLSFFFRLFFIFLFFYPFTFHSMEEVEEAHFSFAMYNREMFRIVVDLIYDGQYKS